MNDNKIKSILKKAKKDSSDISSYDSDDEKKINNLTTEDIKSQATQNYVETELVEKITKYFHIDETIKDKQKELRLQMKALKTQKTDMEKYIISYLEAINEEFVNIQGTARLTKTTTNTKGAIKVDNIKMSVIDGIKKQNINLDERKIGELLDSVVDNIEKNRPLKTKTYIKRTKDKPIKSNDKKNNIPMWLLKIIDEEKKYLLSDLEQDIDDEKNKSTEQELSEDLLSIVHIYCCRQMGKRSYKKH